MPTSIQIMARANERVREWLNRRLDQDSLDIARLYKGSRDRLMMKLRGLYDAYLAEEPTYVRARTTGTLTQMQKTIEMELDALTDEMGQRAVAKTAELLNIQPDVLDRQLGKHFARKAFEDLPISTRQVLGELTTSVVGGATFEDRLFNVSDLFKRDLTNNLRRGLITGKSFDDIRKDMMKSFGVDKLAEPKYNASGSVKLYKNEARRQWNLLMKQQAERADAVEVWWAMIDDPTVTPGCVARHGMLIDDELDGEAPPRHYNCRCIIAVMTPDADLTSERRRALARLEKMGYSRRQAMAEESEPGWGWGHDVLQPIGRITEVARLSGATYRSISWQALPREAAGLVVDARWFSSPRVGVAGDRPDRVLLRSTGKITEVKVWRGWRPVDPQGVQIETMQGVVDDSAVIQPPWDGNVQRLPVEIRQRWPMLTRLTFPVQPRYAVALVDKHTAEQLTLGHHETVAWEIGQDLASTLMHLFWRTGHPSEPHLVFASVAEPMIIKTIVNITTGEVIYATDNFASSLLAPYTRVAAAVLDRAGRIWAVMPRALARWVLPGGHVDPGESPSAAVVREMLEETGQHVRVERLFGTLYRPWSNTLIFLCRHITEHRDWSPTDETDAVMQVNFTDLALDERLFLERHGVKAQWADVRV